MMNVATGSYTGNGSSQSISGLGFQPVLVWIKRSTAVASVYKFASMPSTASHLGTQTVNNTSTITALNSDGFSVGSAAEANTNGGTYYWVAMGGTTAQIKTGSYTGNGSSGHGITGVGFQPAFVLTCSRNAGTNYWGCYRHAGHSAGESQLVGGATIENATITSFDSDGFTVGSRTDLNGSGDTIDYVAIKADSLVMFASSYSGNGADNRSLTGASFTPLFGIVQRRDTTGGDLRFSTMPSDTDGAISALSGNTANRLQNFVSGGIEVGTDARVNSASGTTTYYWLVFGQGNTAPSFSVQPSTAYGSFTRAGPNNTPVVISFTPLDAEQTGADALSYEIRTSATPGAGSLAGSGTCTSGASKSHNLAYNATGIVDGTTTLWVHLSDGIAAVVVSNSFSVLRDDVAPTASTSISMSPIHLTRPTKPYSVTYTPNDARSTGAGEMTAGLYKSSGGVGLLQGHTSLTSGTPDTFSNVSNDDALVTGANTRYIRTRDGANNFTDTSFTVNVDAYPTFEYAQPIRKAAPTARMRSSAY